MLEAQLLKSKRLNRYGIEQLPLMPGWNGKINLVVQKEIFSTFKFLSKKTIQDVPRISEWCFQAVMPNMSEMEQKQYFKALKSCLYQALLEQRAYVKKKVMKKLAVSTLCHVVALLYSLFLTYTSF